MAFFEIIRACLALGALVLVIGSVITLWHGWVVYAGASRRRPIDMSGLSYEPPADLKALIDELPRHGFRRLGETTVPIPGASRIPNSWLLVDESGTVVAESVAFGPFLALVTYFGDRAVVTTSYPSGERIDQSDFVWQRAASVTDAVHDHQAAVSRMASSHGRPVHLTSMADYLEWDAIDRELYTVRRLRWPFVRSAIPTALMGSVGTIAAILLIRA